ncbi:neurogenic locus notch homolog protein 2-like isoform X1 [Haliotis rubra]|uniref:neurogenic locus notch homolog protein 2-like isoform X1 n=1 Tax=Haliotis rubra TaxID=36100 RepID=UPI001EE616D8|nr:neurogenic locus notch homolog protein 2-like isoform X1 [Haliotis rubra]
MYRCYIACCPGWKFDEELRTCSIRVDPKPAIECMNGGTAVEDDSGPKCECPSMYTGTRCEEVKCDLECMNDGMCDVVGGRPRCVCSEHFNGTRCENPVCENGCGSYGNCVAEDGEARCSCIHGYTGRNCDRRVPEPEKEGDCPPLTPTSVGTCAVSCEVDSECPLKQKCCSNGCGRLCAHPANYTCPYLGHNYKIGDIFYPTACDVCTCMTPDPSKPYGGAKCQRQSCPPVENCQEIRQDETKCCEYCADPAPVKPDLYKEPTFLNCPKLLVIVDVAQDKNRRVCPRN